MALKRSRSAGWRISSQSRAGPSSAAAPEPEQVLGLGPGEDAVARHVPVPDDVAGAGQRQRLPLGVADRPLRDDAAGEGVLHDREADQQHDQHQPAGERRLDRRR